MAWLLGTNAALATPNDPASGVAARPRRLAAGEAFVPSVVLHELYYGAFRSARSARNAALVDGLRFGVLDLDREDAREAGAIRPDLAARGTPIGPYDVLIAGQARARGLVLVTRNTTGAFARVPGLRVEDWTGAAPG